MGIFEKTILYVCAVLITLVAGLLMVQPLHASLKLLKPNIFDCVLQSADENNIEQFMNDEPRTLTCTYKCKDAKGKWRWAEQQSNKDGCKFNKTLYKTELINE